MTVKIYQVGGSVRDKLMGVVSKDIDFAVEAESFQAMKDHILERGYKIYLETPKFMTIRAQHPDLGGVDFSLCRKDGEYHNGRHPDDVESGTILDDLARRDFTMNAIAIDVDSGEILDPHNGREDIDARKIRAVGSAKVRFGEDKLRALRALRFAITKNMTIASDTLLELFALDDVPLTDFDAVSTDRIRDELYKMFAANTKRTIQYVLADFAWVLRLCESRGIWFKPTTEIIK